MPVFKTKNEDNKHDLEVEYEKLKDKVDGYFSNEGGSNIVFELNEILTGHFLRKNESRRANIQLTGSELPEILRQLDLV